MKKTGKTAAKGKTKGTAKSTASGTKKTAAARKKTRTTKATPKKSVARKPKTAKKSTKTRVKKKAAAKKRTASTTKKTAGKKPVRKKAAPKSTKRTAKKKAVSKTTKRKPAPKKRPAQKPAQKPARKPARKPVQKPARKPSGKPAPAPRRRAARMIKPRGNGLREGPELRASKAYQIKKGEPYMNPQQLEHFNQLLLDWKGELMKEVDRTVDHMKSDATNFADPADRATQEEEFSLELRTRDRERKLIKKIDEALGMIDMDEYGFCSACGAEIGVRRLEARPTATLCIDCKTMQELKEKQIAD